MLISFSISGVKYVSKLGCLEISAACTYLFGNENVLIITIVKMKNKIFFIIVLLDIIIWYIYYDNTKYLENKDRNVKRRFICMYFILILFCTIISTIIGLVVYNLISSNKNVFGILSVILTNVILMLFFNMISLIWCTLIAIGIYVIVLKIRFKRNITN
ncbi:hypothetical protein BTTOUR_03180 [Bacillus thuringiensis serovar toumanoffi]|uniref:Uncharacterized protein n=7 Tax=Bacteria TaxID=2 RepID=A0ABD5HS82_BACTU|nr:hypothetical protein [Bacillus thuringiensis serovar toumanoffi]